MPHNVKNQRFETGRTGPGPAAYRLPTAVGYDYEGIPARKIVRMTQPPKMYSFGVRTGTRYNTIGPGPVPNGAPNKSGTYDDVVTRHGRTASYKYSFGLRTHLRDRDRKPGPLDCQPDQAKMKKEDYEKIERHTTRTGPLFSFGKRHQNLRGDVIPGPNVYFTADKDTKLLPNFLEAYKKKAPGFVLNSRLRDPIRRESPGAAAYHPYREDKVKGKLVDRVDPTRPKAAEYTMRIRPPTSARTIGPGPIVYDIRPYKGIKNRENIKPIAVDGNRGPTWAFGQRSNRAPMIVPGDNC